MPKKIQIVILITLLPFMVFSQENKVAFLNMKTPWADSIQKTLSNDEKIAQLIHVAAYSNSDSNHMKEISALITKYKIGGLIFFQGGPVRQAIQTNYYQSISNTPLMVSIDAEWGLKMRLDSTIKFPFQMALGAIKNDSLIYEMGREIGRQCVRMGIHVNFAPVADVNNNPDNPVINYRSFGENKYKVTKKSLMYMKGMQDEFIMANAKHFPGHGDTDFDSHKSLPIINHSYERLDSLELFPFKQLIQEGVASIMVAHLSIPSLDSTKNLASTLSKPIVTELLKKKLGFEGIIFTDALNMKGVAKFYKPGQVDVKALLAGNDGLLFSEDVPKAIEEIKKAISKGLITQKEIDSRCYKQLKAKEWAGLAKHNPVVTNNLISDLNNPHAQLLNRKLVESSLTVLKNENKIIPIGDLQNTKIASISIGSDTITNFQRRLTDYSKLDHYYIEKSASDSVFNKLKKILDTYDLIICSLHDLSMRPSSKYGINEEMGNFINFLSKQKNSIIVVFGNAYTLREIEQVHLSKGLIVAYQESDISQDLSAQLIFGGIGANASLPVTVNNHFKEGNGLTTKGGIRFKYTMPEELSMNSKYIHQKVDSIANTAIAKGAFPGCQVFAAKNGKVIFHKTYGYHTYDSIRAVKKSDLYDFASVTKVTGALPSLMKLHDEGKFKLDTPFSAYWPNFDKSNKKEMTVREVLAHQSGMKAWIPYWKNTKKKNGKFKWHTFQSNYSKNYPVKITENLYLHKNYRKKIYKAIKKTGMDEKKYRYSGLSFYLYPEIINNITGIEYETYSKQNFYKPLGAFSITYNPLRFFIKEGIIPTENDTFFRMVQIHGTVHDEGAIMMGGISSNAGLFGSTGDLAKIMQMYLQMGTYGGTRYISDSTLHQFTKTQYPKNDNRRGLGFDKPLLKDKMNSSCARDASINSFGHSGYTGTFAWADPDSGILYLFMSNRVYPTRNNSKIYSLSVRPSIHQVFYDALNQQNNKK